MNEVGLGEALQQARKHKGLTQQQLCQVTGLSYSTLAKIERGAIKSPSIFTVAEIARALGASLDEIIGHVVSGRTNTSNSPISTAKRTAKNGVKFVYFDVNGCLVSHHSAFADIARDSGIGAEQIEYLYWQYNDAICSGIMQTQEVDKILGKALGMPDFSWRTYYTNSVQSIKPLADLVVKLSGEFQVGLLTNIIDGAIPVLRASGKIPNIQYDQIIDSSDVGLIKPNKAIFELATQRAGVRPEEILFVDDTRSNLSAASQLGWRTLLFDTYDPQASTAKILTTLE